MDEERRERRSARFQHCPKGYCCLTPRCPAIDTCAAHRHGRLCGRCVPGYSEALFTPSCVPNEKCGPIWLIPFYIGLGITYTLFLLFQTDLKQFLFSEPIKCGIKKKMRRTHQNGFYNRNEATVQLNGHLQQQHGDGVEIKFMDGNIDGHVDSNVTLTEALNKSEEDVSPSHQRGKHSGSSGGAPDAAGSGGGGGDDAAQGAPKKNSAVRVATGSGFLIIIFYYFQVRAQLQSAFSKPNFRLAFGEISIVCVCVCVCVCVRVCVTRTLPSLVKSQFVH